MLAKPIAISILSLPNVVFAAIYVNATTDPQPNSAQTRVKKLTHYGA